MFSDRGFCSSVYSKVHRFRWSKGTFNVPAESICAKIMESTRFSGELFCLKEEEEEEEEEDVRGIANSVNPC